MLVIRPTQKLAKRLKEPWERSPEPSTTALGDWYCTLLYTKPKQLILAVSEKSRLPLVFLATGDHHFEVRLLAALGKTLMALDVPTNAIALEQAEMSESTVYAKTASRSVLGSMNEYTFMLEQILTESDDLMEATLWLAQVPCGPLDRKRPRDMAVGLLTQLSLGSPNTE